MAEENGEEKKSQRNPLARKRLPPVPKIRTTDGRYMEYQNTACTDWSYELNLEPSRRLYLALFIIMIVIIGVVWSMQLSVFLPVIAGLFPDQEPDISVTRPFVAIKHSTSSAATTTVETTTITKESNQTTESTATTRSTTTPTTTATVKTTPTVVHRARPRFRVGVGRADITGPPTELNFIGHMDLNQTGTGLHTRQFSRAFCFIQGSKKVVFVVAELFAIGYGLRSRVLKRIRRTGGKQEYSIYNVHIAATGTYNTAGSHIAEYLFGVGPPYCEQCMRAYVKGVARSITAACKATKSAYLVLSYGEVYESQINRSLRAYLSNPEKERARYTVPYDHYITQLRIEDRFGRVFGLINWFALHASSVSPTNHTLVSSDNFGYVCLRLEKYFNPKSLAGQAKVVVAFAPSNHGDVSPNINNGSCLTSPQPVCWMFGDCKLESRCLGRGPTFDGYKNAELIGSRMYEGAMKALKLHGISLTGSLQATYRLFNSNDRSAYKIYDPLQIRFLNTTVKLCKPRLFWKFYEGHYDDSLLDKNLHRLKNIATKLLVDAGPCPGRTSTKGQGKGTILHPQLATISVLNLGGLLVACIPGEPTTMAGRRIRDVVKTTMIGYNRHPSVVVSGNVNEYILSIVTDTEFKVSLNTEARQCVYGGGLLSVILHFLVQATKVVLKVTDSIKYSAVGLANEDQYHTKTKNKPSAPPSMIPPRGKTLFEIHSQPNDTVNMGSVVSTKFTGTNPRCSMRHGSTYMQVERYIERIGKWRIVARDAEWETRLMWNNVTFETTLEWHVPNGTVSGEYRIRAFGNTCVSMKQHMNVTDEFEVVGVNATNDAAKPNKTVDLT